MGQNEQAKDRAGGYEIGFHRNRLSVRPDSASFALQDCSVVDISFNSASNRANPSRSRVALFIDMILFTVR